MNRSRSPQSGSSARTRSDVEYNAAIRSISEENLQDGLLGRDRPFSRFQLGNDQFLSTLQWIQT